MATSSTKNKIMKLSQAEYNTLSSTGTLTKDGVTYTYSPSDTIYVTPDASQNYINISTTEHLVGTAFGVDLYERTFIVDRANDVNYNTSSHSYELPAEVNHIMGYNDVYFMETDNPLDDNFVSLDDCQCINKTPATYYSGSKHRVCVDLYDYDRTDGGEANATIIFVCGDDFKDLTAYPYVMFTLRYTKRATS